MSARGRGSAYAVVVLLLLASIYADQAYAVTHTVGGSKGWDLAVDYTSWAAGETFKVGDVLFFPYVKPFHNVVVVDKAGYDACSGANAISTYSAGNDNVTLNATGSHYYLCSLPGHCTEGMKLAVTVAAAAAAPTPTAITAPAPSKTPSSPAPSPLTAVPPPAPAPAPSSPAPTPSGSTPSPVPVPATPAPAPSSVVTPATPPGSTPSTTPSTTASPPPPSTPPPSAAPSASAAALTPLAFLLASFLLSL